MSDYLRVQAQIQKLQQQAERLKKRELAQIISKIKKAIKAYGLTAADLGLTTTSSIGATSARGGRSAKGAASISGRRDRKAGKKVARKSSGIDKRSTVAPKYRDAASGATWTGRGKQPTWLTAAIKGGKKLEDFKI